MDPLTVLFGFGVGVLVGLTGVGGGSLLTPLLVLVVGVNPVVAVGTDIAYGAVTKTLSAARHLRHETVDVPLALWMACGSAPGALAGVGVVAVFYGDRPDDVDQTVLVVLGLALLLACAAVLARMVLTAAGSVADRDDQPLAAREKRAAVAVGVPLGFILASRRSAAARSSGSRCCCCSVWARCGSSAPISSTRHSSCGARRSPTSRSAPST